jgi:hypothetical protein
MVGPRYEQRLGRRQKVRVLKDKASPMLTRLSRTYKFMFQFLGIETPEEIVCGETSGGILVALAEAVGLSVGEEVVEDT